MTATTPLEDRGLRPLVVARRWDQLGGRLNAIVNALSVAELLDLRFRFVWPRSADPAINDPGQIFSQTFLHSFELAPWELENRTALAQHDLFALTDAEARAMLRRSSPDLFVEIDHPFGIVRWAGETAATASQRFERCWAKIGWSDELRRLIALLSDWPKGRAVAAVHVRAGDIVDGEWRQVIVHEKYLPTVFFDAAVNRLTNGRSEVVVLSDDGRLLAWLRRRFPTVITPREVVPGYAKLTKVQRTLADILILSRCSPIVGPPSSAFSRLAANLGSQQITRADELVAAGDELEVLRQGIAARRNDAAKAPYWSRLLARDICWCLDVFEDTLPLKEQHRLARQAAELDPDFSGGMARLARIAAVAGELREAKAALARALPIATSVQRYADALMEALATEVALKCFEAIQTRPPAVIQIKIGSARRAVQKDHERMTAALTAMEHSLGRCQELHPFWIARERVFTDLRYLISIVRWLKDESPKTRRRVARAVAKAKYDDLRAAHSRGLDEHRSLAMYDPLTRSLDRIVLHLRGAIEGERWSEG